MLYRAKLGLICGSLLELSCFELSKLEADLEVSILELYYGTKSFFCEYEQGSVCGMVAIEWEQAGSWLGLIFLILIGRHTCISFEKRKKVGIIGKAEGFGNLGDRHVLFGQKAACLSDLDLGKKIVEAD